MKRILYIIIIAVFTLFGLSCASTEIDNPGTEVHEKTTAIETESPVYFPGNPACTDIGLANVFEFKVDGGPYSGSFTSSDGYLNVDLVSSDGIYVDWASDVGLDAVIVKGGPNANVYFYSPEATSDAALSSPINISNGTPYAISHISFCYDFEVEVEKTAETSFVRTYDWGITKTADATELTLSPGQQYLLDYTVDLWLNSFTDSDFAVAGDITIHNPAPFDAEIEAVVDAVDGVTLPVDCGLTLPTTLAAGDSFVCSYGGMLPDNATRYNVATVTVTETSAVGGNIGEAVVDFADATIFAVDDCAEASDSFAGSLGTYCAAEAPVTVYYSHWIGPYLSPDDCGEHTVVNTAWFNTNDGGDSGSETWTVNVTIPCETGCTLTPGYWKTHSDYGPAPYDDTWALFGGPDTLFFDTGLTWFEQFWTPPKGNAYYILSRAYGAAVLNSYNGADTSSVAVELEVAAELLDTYDGDPVSMDRIKGRVRNDFVSIAGTLDDYNNGLVGPGHCDE